MDEPTAGIGRRRFLGRLGTGAAAIGAVLVGCDFAGPRPAPTPASAAATSASTVAPAAAAPAQATVVRLSSVVIPQDSGLYARLLPEFERRSGYRVEVTTAQDVYGPARGGGFDIVLSHYQHEGVSPFMQDGLGEWPRTILSSPLALVGPAPDPAGVRGLSDLVEAFRRIARTGTFVVNDQDGLRYVGEVTRRAAELPAGGSWYVDSGTRGPEAMRAAAQSGGYTMWGLVPFLRLQQQSKLPLEALVTQDQLLRSLMVTIVVNGDRVGGVNTKGARALQQYLIEPETQAKIRTFRMVGIAEQVWWPAAQDNDKAILGRP
jgi:tungstate transport system substrate-binding protein